MDVPIALGVILAPAMSLAETVARGEHAYFDSAVTLLFFLLIGRYLDQRARGRARSAAERLLALTAGAVTLVLPDGTSRSVRPEQVEAGQGCWSRAASASASTARSPTAPASSTPA